MGWLMAGSYRGERMEPKKAREPSATRDPEDSKRLVIYGSYDHEDPVIQMKAIKEALDAYLSAK